MSILLLSPLVAETNTLSRFFARLAELSPSHATRLGILASSLAIGVLIAWCYSRRSNRQMADTSPHNPQKLFGELCQAHRLTATQRRLLEWLVADRQLIQPALVFLDPILLESAIAHADSPGVRKRLTDLRAKLFGAVETTAAAEAALR